MCGFVPPTYLENEDGSPLVDPTQSSLDDDQGESPAYIP